MTEIAEAQADAIKYLFEQVCSIRRAEDGEADGYGGRAKRWRTVASFVPCLVQRSRRAQKVEEGVQLVSLGEWEVLLPLGTIAQPSDIVEVTGSAYEVIGSDHGRARALWLTLYCTRIN